MRIQRLSLLLVAAAALMWAAPAGAFYYWQPNGWDGTGDVPSGTWSTSAANWNNGTSYQAWNSANATAAIFCYTGVSTPTNNYTVTVVAPTGGINVPAFTCQAGNPIVTGDPLFLTQSAAGPYTSIDVSSNLTLTLNCALTNWMAAANLEALHKWNRGTLVLGAVNHLQNVNNRPGDIVVEGGTLRMAVAQVFGYANNLVLANGITYNTTTGIPLYIDTPVTFDTGGLNQSLGTLNIKGPNAAIARTIDFGNGASALAFADSSAQPWPASEGYDIFLHIVNYTAGVDSLRFGTSASGLTARQLQLLRFADFTNAIGQIDANGFVTPGLVPPTIVSDPQATNVNQGQPASFTVVATGPGLTYQWRKDGVNIPAAGNPSAITATLVLNNVQPSDTASYTVAISNAATTVISRPGQLNAIVLQQGLVSYWPMESAANPNPDPSFGNNMEVVGAPTVVPGRVGNALSFASGSGSYLRQLHTDTFENTGLPIWNAGQYTIAFWVRCMPGAKTLFSEASTVNPTLYMFSTLASGKLDVYLRDASNVLRINHQVSGAVVADNTWHHVAFVDNRGTVALYVDGVLDVNSPAMNYTYTPGSVLPNTTGIGGYYRNGTSGAPFNTGVVDEVAVWERALSSGEVSVLKTGGVPTPIGPRGAAIVSITPNAAKFTGDSHQVVVRAMNNRPFSYTWRTNGVVDPNVTGTTYSISGLTAANNGETFAVTVDNGIGSASATNTITVSSDPPPMLSNGTVNYWPLDTITTDGGNLFSPDLYLNQSMVLSNFLGTDDLVMGMRGNALWFDTTKYGYRSGGSPIYSRTNYTVAMWVNLPSGGFNLDAPIYVEASTANGNTLFELRAAEPGISVLIRNDAGVTLLNQLSTTTVVDYGWHYVVWTDANGQGKLYIDGVPDATDFTYVRSTLTPNTTAIGAAWRGSPSANKLYGTLDEIATWKRALTLTEVQQAMTSGMPATPPPAAPTITTQPQDASLYLADAVALTVQAEGYYPLSYQWRKNGNVMSGATTTMLAFANLQSSDSASYSVVITNVGGSITSRVAQLTVSSYALATSGDVLKVDFGVGGATPSPVQPGFVLGSVNLVSEYVGGARAAVSALTNNDGGLSTLATYLTTGTVDNPPALNQAAIYNDGVYVSSTGTNGDGLRISMDRLAPNTRFGVIIWSFDSAFTVNQPRFSTWLETSGTPVPIAALYAMNGNNVPTYDYENIIMGTVTSTPAGTLQIDALNHGWVGGVANGVFLNAIQLIANPPVSLANPRKVGGNLRFDVTSDFAYSILQNASLVGGTWVPAQSGGPISTNGATVTYEFPIQQNPLFYRAQ